MMNTAKKTEPTPQAVKILKLIKFNGIWQKPFASELYKLYAKGKLGEYPLSLDLFTAGERWARDYSLSIFSPKVTANMDEVKGAKCRGSDSRINDLSASDRYLDVSRELGKYLPIVQFVVLEDKSLKKWIKSCPVLNDNGTTYRVQMKSLIEGLKMIESKYREFKKSLGYGFLSIDSLS